MQGVGRFVLMMRGGRGEVKNLKYNIIRINLMMDVVSHKNVYQYYVYVLKAHILHKLKNALEIRNAKLR